MVFYIAMVGELNKIYIEKTSRDFYEKYPCILFVILIILTGIYPLTNTSPTTRASE